MKFLVPIACLVLLSGCIVQPAPYHQVQYAPTQPTYNYAPPPQVDIVPNDYVIVNGTPSVYVGGVPFPLILEGGLGWGWWGPGHVWHGAPGHWQERLNRDYHERRMIRRGY